MNILFLAHSETDQTPQHRVTPIAQELKKRGHECTVYYGIELNILGRCLRFVDPRSLLAIAHDPEYDAVVVSRDGSPVGLSALLLANYQDIPTIFDIDDPLYMCKRVAGTSLPNPAFTFVDSMIISASAVTTSNKSIQNYTSARANRSYLIPTPVDTDIFHPRREPPESYDEIVIGWMGAGPSHEDNLPLLVEPIKRVAEEYKVRLRLLSALDSEKIHETFEPLEGLIPIDYGFDEWVPMSRIADEMASFDIAVLPLNDRNEFMEGKSIIKATEHLAMEIPVIVSDFGAYARLINHGETGLVASSTEEWTNNLKRLISSPARRKRIASQGCEMVRENFSVEAFSDEFERILMSM